MPSALCAQLVAACKNMRCEVKHMVSSGRVQNHDVALGPSIRTMHARVQIGPLDIEELVAAMSACTQLEKFGLDVSSSLALNTLKDIFHRGKPMLQDFALSLLGPGCHNKTVRELGSYVGNLRQFSFSGHLAEFGDFKPVARGAPLLQRAEIFVDGELTKYSRYEARVVDVVQTFLGCPDMHQLLFRTFPCDATGQRLEQIADLCTRLRLWKKPDSYVEVFSVDYLA